MTASRKLTVQPVILCGGSGTRLWPLSRAGFPKQFLCLTGDDSLFQQAAKRLGSLGAEDIAMAAPLIVSNEEHRFLAHEQLREAGIEPVAMLLEPIARNTAPALTLAALAASSDEAKGLSIPTPNSPSHLSPNDVDPILVVIPADQTVADRPAFTAAMQAAIREAATGAIVILGIAPDRPETGYGYIKVLRTQDSGLSTPSAPATQHSVPGTQSLAFEVDRFVEKPDAVTAQRYLDEGGYYWNAGMFVLKASVWLAALERFRPDIANATRIAWAARTTDTQSSALGTQNCFIRPGKPEFTAIPAESIDYAVMEPLTTQSSILSPHPSSLSTDSKSSSLSTASYCLKMVPLAAGWSDLGAWDAVWQVLDKDDDGNAHLGDVITTGSRNTLVHATSRLVTLVGVEDIVVIETPDAVLVANRSSSQDVKKIVDTLKNSSLKPHHSALSLLHRKVHRPWGWYDSIDDGHRFKVKRIQVNPKCSLSLQMHHHRAEHWIVVRGTAEITNGDKVILLTENQSTYISLGETHRLANPGTIPLEIIEVQSGSYLGEDDIVRFEDNYGRQKKD
jgi:mannose-1-phosphate guanylyltransferase/mannose-6-phosphate isomerase